MITQLSSLWRAWFLFKDTSLIWEIDWNSLIGNNPEFRKNRMDNFLTIWDHWMNAFSPGRFSHFSVIGFYRLDGPSKGSATKHVIKYIIFYHISDRQKFFWNYFWFLTPNNTLLVTSWYSISKYSIELAERRILWCSMIKRDERLEHRNLVFGYNIIVTCHLSSDTQQSFKFHACAQHHKVLHEIIEVILWSHLVRQYFGRCFRTEQLSM